MERASGIESRADPGPGAMGYARVATWTVGFWLLCYAIGALAFGLLTVGILVVGVVLVQIPVAAGMVAYLVGLILAGRRCHLRGATQWACAAVVSIVPVLVVAAVSVLALAALGV